MAKNISKNQIKNIILLCVYILLGVAVLSMFFSFNKREKHVEVSSTYTIKYYAIENGKLAVIPSDMFQKNSNYPTVYNHDERVYVDNLNEISFRSENSDRIFCGWYLDKECTVPFENGARYNANLLLYAKIEVGFWSPWVPI